MSYRPAVSPCPLGKAECACVCLGSGLRSSPLTSTLHLAPLCSVVLPHDKMPQQGGQPSLVTDLQMHGSAGAEGELSEGDAQQLLTPHSLFSIPLSHLSTLSSIPFAVCCLTLCLPSHTRLCTGVEGQDGCCDRDRDQSSCRKDSLLPQILHPCCLCPLFTKTFMPSPCTPHPASCSLRPAPSILHPAPGPLPPGTTCSLQLGVWGARQYQEFVEKAILPDQVGHN